MVLKGNLQKKKLKWSYDVEEILIKKIIKIYSILMAYAYTTFYLTTVAMLLLDILYLMLMIYGLYTLLRRTNRTKSFALNL